MPFFVPDKQAGLFDQVDQRFRLLLQKGVVSGISEIRFDKWLANFRTEEDRYLCAQLLSNLSFRSEGMVASAIRHIVQCILPGELRRLGIAPLDLDAFLTDIARGGQGRPIRFVQANNARASAGKSGAVIIRELHRLGDISNQLLCLVSDIPALPKSVRCLVFVDDMVGTGQQFSDFATATKLQQYAASHQVIYCPLAAYSDGLSKLSDDHPWLKVCPVEEFGTQHQFFRANDQGLWALDSDNTTQDVRAHVQALCSANNIPKPAFSLDLLLGFHHATPNNTLPLMWAHTPAWHPLLIR